MVCIATFCDREEEALCSGPELVRKYLDVAFEGSQQYIPGDVRTLADRRLPHRGLEPREPQARLEGDAGCIAHRQKVGKNLHLEALRKRLAPQLKRSEIVLFDDSEANIVEVCYPPAAFLASHLVRDLQARAKGYAVQLVDAPKVDDAPTPAPTDAPADASVPAAEAPAETTPRGGFCRAAWTTFLEADRAPSPDRGCRIA